MSVYLTRIKQTTEVPNGVVAKVLNCDIVETEFERQSHYYVHFQYNTLGKGMNSHISPPARGYIIPQMFYKNGFGIK